VKLYDISPRRDSPTLPLKITHVISYISIFRRIKGVILKIVIDLKLTGYLLWRWYFNYQS